VIEVDPDSDAAGFDWESGAPDAFYPMAVDWLIPVPTDGGSVGKVARALEGVFRTGHWPDAWRHEVATVWRRIALHEALAYLRLAMDDHHLNLRVGEKTTLVLEETLERFSIGQTYNFIWRAARDAAAYFQRGDVPRAQAANSAIGRIQRQAERAIVDCWDVKHFGRDWRCPQSA
jgi:hypothetical protein